MIKYIVYTSVATQTYEIALQHCINRLKSSNSFFNAIAF